MRRPVSLACVLPIVLALVALVALVPPAAAAGKRLTGVVNLNTAPVEVLGLLPGVGPAKAAEIARYRQRRSFRTVDELVRIRGIGRQMVRRLRPHLATAGPTTAARADGAAPPPPPPPSPSPAARLPALAARPLCRPVPSKTKKPSPDSWPSHGACLRPR